MLRSDSRRVYVTREPSDGPIGELACELTETLRGNALACLYAADRYHHLTAEVFPHLEAGEIVITRPLHALGSSDPWSPTSAHLSQVFGRRSVKDARSKFAGGVLTSHFEWHDRSHASADLGAAGGGGRPILTAGPCVSLLRSSIHSAICAGQPRRLAVRGGASLVMQQLDGVDPDYLWRINAKASPPDLAVILDADPAVVSDRLRDRGPRNRLQKLPSLAHLEWHHYREVTHRLTNAGWTIQRIDCSATTVDEVAHIVRARLHELETGEAAAGLGSSV